jgi:predicted nucleotidyltransferase
VIRPVRRGSGLGISDIVEPRLKALEEALRANKARNPRVFGSVARNEASLRSDLDLLVDFEPGASAFDQVGLISDLERVFRRKVDVAEPSGLHWLVRSQVLFEAVAV